MPKTRNAILAVLAAALVCVSCARERPTSPFADIASLATQRRAASADTVLYGPATFIRDTGKPRTDTTSFRARAGDTLTVRLSSPAPQGLNATAELNGRMLYASAAGHPLPDSVRVLARDVNAVRVWMAGKPGSMLRIAVSGPGSTGPVESRALTLIYGSGVQGSVPPGVVDYSRGSTVRYRFAPSAGFTRLRVVLDGRLAPDSGTLTMDRPHWIAAASDTAFTLDGRELSLAQELRALLSSTSIRRDWVRYQNSLALAANEWGAAADLRLAKVELATIDPVTDADALRRMDSTLAGIVTEGDALGGTINGLRSTSASSLRATRAGTRSTLTAEPVEREPTEIVLINGIRTSGAAFRDVASRFFNALWADPTGRFPRTSVFPKHVYNSSIVEPDTLQRVASLCLRRAHNETTFRAGAELLVFGATFATCLAGTTLRYNDYVETLDFAYRIVHDFPVNSDEVSRLDSILDYDRTVRGRHVFVVAHSEGSLITQSAIRKLQTEFGFDEDTAARCLGTVSVAGASTLNWPLSARHASFVVAKGDFVTKLPGDLRNFRETMEDDDTRYVDAQLDVIPQEPIGMLLRVIASVYYPVKIHSLSRYLASAQMWPRIKDNLDALYRTCAVGTVAVTPATATVQLFGAMPFSAAWHALDGLPLNTADSVRWSVDSSLASVSRSGTFQAEGSVGTVSLQANVRQLHGSAVVSIVDDSARALYQPPQVSVSVRVWASLEGDEEPISCTNNSMTVSASAMPGATVTSVKVYQRRQDTLVEYWVRDVPANEEIRYQVLCDIWYVPGSIFPEWGWYRVVVTDSHGLVTERVATTP